ncbi:MAG: hypothetical protein COB98_08740 [Flavobacteriaceae bacterium]|nr:MAG: hypothetical protein COB98_08740 [Flavobacteriaceae bacterium]
MIRNFFWMCSGADTDILASCPKAEQIKYAGIGATVFFTAIMAFIAASYALFTIFDTVYAAVFFGCIWGLLIFNLDRFIVSTIKKKDNKRTEFTQAIPRIILAIIIAVVISKPLELKIFEKEINQVLLEQKNERTLTHKNQISLQYAPEKDALITEIAQLKSEIKNKETNTNALYETYISEAEGRKGTKLLGKGPVYKDKFEKHQHAFNELQALKTSHQEKITQKEARIATLEQEQKASERNGQPIIDNMDGLMARITALGTLPFIPSFFIFLLFLCIETSPIIAKLLASKGVYDFKLEALENDCNSWSIQQQTHRKLVLETDHNINLKIYEELATEKEIYQYKKQKARELLQLQADAFYLNSKKSL